MRIQSALISGAVGSVTLTTLHQVARRLTDHPPRMDVIGMRGIARSLRAVGAEPPPHDALYNLTMVGDLIGNALYYSLTAADEPTAIWQRGGVLGLAAGIGAVILPEPLGLGRQPHARFPETHIMTVAWYLLGGLAAAGTAVALQRQGM